VGSCWGAGGKAVSVRIPECILLSKDLGRCNKMSLGKLELMI